MNKRILKNMEWWLVVWCIALCVIGLIALFSATSEAEFDEFNKQIIWIGVSIVAMVIVMMIDYNFLVKISPILYRNIFNTISCSTIHNPNKWCNKLVFDRKLFCVSTSRICKNSGNIIFSIWNFKTSRKRKRTNK